MAEGRHTTLLKPCVRCALRPQRGRQDTAWMVRVVPHHTRDMLVYEGLRFVGLGILGCLRLLESFRCLSDLGLEFRAESRELRAQFTARI